MQDKVLVLVFYAFSGLVIALWPIWVKEKFEPLSSLSIKKIGVCSHGWAIKLVLLLLANFAFLRLTNGSGAISLAVALALIALTILLSELKFDILEMLSILLSLCVSTTIPWWRRQSHSLDVSNYEFMLFGAILFVIVQLFSKRWLVRESKFPYLWIIFFTAIAFTLAFSTGIMADDNALFFQWHHWSAYIGPAETLLSGAAIFRDFPAQYGLGPTALIASFCGGDCWTGMYFITGFTTVGLSVLLTLMGLYLSRNCWQERLAVVMLCLATCFFWTAYPPGVMSPTVTPSVSGLRFLPSVILVTYLFFVPTIEASKNRMLIAHGLWIFGVLWSPESAFYVTFIWWPYYLFIFRIRGDLSTCLKSFLKNSTRLVLIGIGLAVIFNIVFWIVYHEGPTLYGFLTYVINPPGPLPIDFHGGVWVFLLITAIGLSTLFYSWHKFGDTISFRRGYLIQLLSYSVFSYFLGRSHDNNLLNIMPFVLLVLLNSISAAEIKLLRKVSVILASTFIGWLVLFGWDAWQICVKDGRLLEFNSVLLSKLASITNFETDKKIIKKDLSGGSKTGLPQDASTAIVYIREHFHEPVTVLDSNLCLENSGMHAVWSAIHDPANFTYVPSEHRKEFLKNTAESLKRSGWLVIDRNFPANDWLSDFDNAYDRTNLVEFGTYYAIRYTPKFVVGGV